MAVKAYFSGVESSQHWQHCIDADVRHCLMSFWQFKDKDRDVVKRRKLSNPKVNFMIDSGAHSLITNWRDYMHWKRSDFDKYVEDYVKWIYDNRKYISCAVEVDIDWTLNHVLAGNAQSNLGTQIVESWQKNLFYPLQKKGIDIIYVWHDERKMDGWEEMCAKFDYVGLPGFKSSEADFNKFMTIARRYTTRVHGFAATKQLDFRDVPWFSIDSITWKSPEIWGVMLVWDERNQKFISEGDKTKRIKYRDIIAASPFNADKIVKDSDYKEGTKYGLYSMRQMEAFYERKYSDRTFYYELRLPHRDVICKLALAEKERMWGLFHADSLFKDHAQLSKHLLGDVLCTISAVQNGDSSYLGNSKTAMDFLGRYFPKLVNPLVSDIKLLQQEFANYTSPRNPAPLERTEAFHYVTHVPLPKPREKADDLTEGELEFDDPAEHYLAIGL